MRACRRLKVALGRGAPDEGIGDRGQGKVEDMQISGAVEYGTDRMRENWKRR
jgi:hypothetical protein